LNPRRPEKGMRIGRGRQIRLNRWCCWFLAGLGIALVARLADAQPFEYIITFENVVIQEIEGIVDTPEVAHRELPGAETSSSPAESGADRTKPGARSNPQLPNVPLGSFDSQLSFAPGQGHANQRFVQAGFLVEAFWALKTGRPDASFKPGHFHPPSLSSGFEAQHLGNRSELHGLYIRSLDGKPFGLKGLRYRVTRNRQLPNKPFSIDGFSNFSVNVLVATLFDPRRPVRTQFESFPVGLPAGNDPRLPWWPLRIFGFERVNQLYIASSASVDLDDIVLTRSEPPPAPKGSQEGDK
jgi:hypothetical protein